MARSSSTSAAPRSRSARALSAVALNVCPNRNWVFLVQLLSRMATAADGRIGALQIPDSWLPDEAQARASPATACSSGAQHDVRAARHGRCGRSGPGRLVSQSGVAGVFDGSPIPHGATETGAVRTSRSPVARPARWRAVTRPAPSALAPASTAGAPGAPDRGSPVAGLGGSDQVGMALPRNRLQSRNPPPAPVPEPVAPNRAAATCRTDLRRPAHQAGFVRSVRDRAPPVKSKVKPGTTRGARQRRQRTASPTRPRRGGRRITTPAKPKQHSGASYEAAPTVRRASRAEFGRPPPSKAAGAPPPRNRRQRTPPEADGKEVRARPGRPDSVPSLDSAAMAEEMRSALPDRRHRPGEDRRDPRPAAGEGRRRRRGRRAGGLRAERGQGSARPRGAAGGDPGDVADRDSRATCSPTGSSAGATSSSMRSSQRSLACPRT